jgi:hypothetical protein
MFRHQLWFVAIQLLSTLCRPAVGATLEFTPAKVYSVPPGAGRIVVGDFNGDGKADLGVASQVVSAFSSERATVHSSQEF